MSKVSNEKLAEQGCRKPLYPEFLVRSMLENINEGIMVTDANKRIINVNAAFEFVTGYKEVEVVGQSPSVLQSGVHELDFYLTMWEQIKTEGSWQGEIWNRRKTGDLYPEWLHILAIKNDQGELTNYCGIFTDLSEQKTVENELEQRMFKDSLTNVSNRFAYFERMQLLIDSSTNRLKPIQHAVLFLNIKRFKQLNDTVGHATADLILIELAKRIQVLVKNRDIVARYGSDEFVITLTNIASIREVNKFAEHLLDEIERAIVIDQQEIYVSAHMGISMYPVDGDTTEMLINRADKAMIYSKEDGSTRYSFYFDELYTDAKRVLLMDTELRHAINNRKFKLHLQPKLCLKTNRLIGVEALVRWTNAKLGFVSPAEFIPYSEETGLIIPLSENILEMACEAYIGLRDAGYGHLSIAINISSIHFQQSDFLSTVQNILTKYNVSPTNFEIELTERTVMSDNEETVNKLIKLKELGFNLSIDDFGTGYSSLSYLVRFPLDILKIDRSFIQQVSTVEEKQAVVDAIIHMSHRLKMKVVAEGVETADQLTMLKELGCDYIQGYYFSKPLPIEELVSFIQKQEVEQQGRI